MSKKCLSILLILAILISSFPIIKVDAATTKYTATVTDREGVNVRTGPGTNNDIAGVLSYAATVSLINTTKHKGDGCSGGWYQINYKSSTDRYICSDLVKVNTVSTEDDFYTSSVWGYRINENYATVRKSASTSSSSVDRIYLGTTVDVVGTAKASSGCSEGWYKITYYNNTKTGYVCKRLVDKYEDITASDAAYEKVLKEEGFPESYWPFLVKLHQLHPNWVFKAEQTGLDFAASVDGEEGKNYIQSTEDAYRLSDTIKENPNWYAASNPVVAYFLDPRNYLNEKNIFVFEDLGYDKENHTAKVVKAIFGSSYLADDEYVGYFMKAAQDFNVSPIHLASRVIQEGGSNENYDAVSGKSKLTYQGKSLVGYYNYYNIGAKEDKYTDSAVTRGLAVAAGYTKDNYAGLPWDTREKAIYYGASFIANSYVNQGQNTMYYQKFNTGPNASNNPYTHQYMTNIIAPASESLSTYSTYVEEDLLDSAFVFKIPVYDNMPEDFTIHPLVGDTNNNLSELKVNNTTVNGFDPDVITYTQYINQDTTSVNITAKAESSKSTISGTGEIKITSDETVVKIIVTNEVGDTKTYTLTLIKADQDSDNPSITVEEILNKVDVKINDSYMSGITAGTTATSLANLINKQGPDAVIKITDSSNKNKTSTLATGDKINIKVGNDEKSYTIVIKGDNNGDGKVTILDLLRVQKHILKSSTLTGAYKEACDTNYDDDITILDLLRVQKHILKAIVLK